MKTPTTQANNPFAEPFRIACDTPGDINEHLPTLADFACECDHVTEFGVRTGASTIALLYAAIPRGAIVHSYDINDHFNVAPRFRNHYAYEKWTFFLADTSALAEIHETDMLLIDTAHHYDQVKAELKHADRVKKCIIFHDTETYRLTGDNGGIGIQPAIEELLEEGKWVVHKHYRNNNGLTVLRRK